MSYGTLPNWTTPPPPQFEVVNILMVRPESARLEMGASSRVKMESESVGDLGSAVVLVERRVKVRRRTWLSVVMGWVSMVMVRSEWLSWWTRYRQREDERLTEVKVINRSRARNC